MQPSCLARYAALLAFALTVFWGTAAPAAPRAKALLAAMTLEEKVGQLFMSGSRAGRFAGDGRT